MKSTWGDVAMELAMQSRPFDIFEGPSGLISARLCSQSSDLDKYATNWPEIRRWWVVVVNKKIAGRRRITYLPNWKLKLGLRVNQLELKCKHTADKNYQIGPIDSEQMVVSWSGDPGLAQAPRSGMNTRGGRLL